MGIRSIAECDKCGKEIPPSLPAFHVRREKRTAGVVVERGTVDAASLPDGVKLACTTDCLLVLLVDALEAGTAIAAVRRGAREEVA
jgi:hypothetical protein